MKRFDLLTSGSLSGRLLRSVLALSFAASPAMASAQTIFRDASDNLPPEPVVTDPSQGPQFQTNTQDAAFIDIEGDGDLDVYLAVGTNNVFGRENRLLENDGNGNFTDVTSTHLPPTSNFPYPPGPAFSGASDVGDINGDGYPDIVVANLGFNTLILNDGTGHFIDASHLLPAPPAVPGVPFPFNLISTRPALTDVNGDGRLDILMTGEIPPIPPIGPAGLPTLVLVQQADGSFADETATRIVGGVNEATLNVLVFDIDGDGDDDFLEANIGQNQIYVNDGSGVFTNDTANRLPTEIFSTRTIAVGDIDGDGDLDFVAGNSNAQQNQIFINDGNGAFSDETAARFPVFFDTSSDTELFDVDYDGDLDVIFANSNLVISPISGRPTPAPGPNALYLNDGLGNFDAAGPEWLPDVWAPSFEVDIADLNGDGLDDIFVSNSVNTEENLFLRDIPPATPSAGSHDLVPVLYCVESDGEGSYTAYFGYQNLTGDAAYVEYGNKNRVIVPNGAFDGQPSAFLPGGTDLFPSEIVAVTFSSTAVWNLNGRVAVANHASPDCNSGL